MDKKTKIIYICLASFVIIVLILSRIVDNKNDNKNDNSNSNNNNSNNNISETINKNFTCTSNNEEWSFEVYNDKLSKLYVKYIKSETNYNNLTAYQKQEIEDELLYDLGIEKFSYNGINVKLTYSNNLTVEITIDYSKADENILKKMGLNYNKNIKFSSVKELLLKDNTYTCK